MRRLALILLVLGVAASAAAAVPTAPPRNGQILFAVSWPTDLRFATAAPEVRQDLCGAAPGAPGRRWTAVDPGMLVESAAAAPDGTRVAATVVGTGAELTTVSAGSRRPVRLRSGGTPSWSPDGRSLAFVDAVSPAQPNTAQIFVLDVASGAAVQLTSGPGDSLQPRWSPDGSTIAFVSSRSGTNQVYAMRADGSAVRQLTFPPGENVDPFWSPDGTRLVFASGRNGGDDRLYTMAADGSGIAPVGSGVLGASPAWSPDGRFIAFARNEHLYVVATDGSGPRLAYPGPIAFGPTDWAPAPAASLPAGPTCIRWASSQGSRIAGTTFADVIEGGPGTDRISTGGGADQVSAGPGADRVAGGPGNDWLDGEQGNDTLLGDSGNDVLSGGPGRDTIRAGAGNDRVFVRDGTRDTVSCGTGRDTVYVDQLDVVTKDCEQVLRRHVASGP